MKSGHQKLLPGPPGINQLNGQSANQDKCISSRSIGFINPIACGRCRIRKTKCDGQRPTCGRCSRSGSDCRYDAAVGESRSLAMKKKYSALINEVWLLKNEIHQLKRSYVPVRAVSEDDIYEGPCYSHSTSYQTPNTLQSPNNNGVLAAEEYNSPHNLTKTQNHSNIEPFSGVVIGVPALPWTSTAGDDVVSELISQYFTLDYLYVFPPILRYTFTSEMIEGNPSTATCCTPLLVNAICAHQCFLSPRRFFGDTTRQELAKRFLEQANGLLHMEFGRISLATSQATCLMYAALAANAQTDTSLEV